MRPQSVNDAAGEVPTPGETRRLVDFLHLLSPDQLSGDTLDYTKLLVLDTLGAGIFGSHTEAGQAVRRGRGSISGTTPIWGTKSTADPQRAAFVNGVQCHAFELDDYCPEAKIHPGACVLPAAFSIVADSRQHGERVPGPEFLAAIVAGYEIAIRASIAAGAKSVRARGWHVTGVLGPLGAAVAAGRLLRLDGPQLRTAVGIAASFGGGVFAFSRSGAMTKYLHAGHAAESGVRAALLAAQGVTAPTDVLDGVDGGLLHALSDVAVPSRLTLGLGSGLMLDDVAIKPYPCCGSIHSAIDGLLQMMRQEALTAATIARVRVGTARAVDLQCGFPYTGLGGVLEAQMSMKYCLAAAAIDDSVSIEQFGPERRRNPDVMELASCIDVVLDEQVEASYPQRFSARVTVITTDGKERSLYVDDPPGAGTRRLSEDDTHAKFMNLTAGILSPAGQSAVVKKVMALTDHGYADELLKYLTGGDKRGSKSVRD